MGGLTDSTGVGGSATLTFNASSPTIVGFCLYNVAVYENPIIIGQPSTLSPIQ
jgi:hypothetical protein